LNLEPYQYEAGMLTDGPRCTVTLCHNNRNMLRKWKFQIPPKRRYPSTALTNGRMKWMGPNMRYYPIICLEGLPKIKKKLERQDIQSPKGVWTLELLNTAQEYYLENYNQDVVTGYGLVGPVSIPCSAGYFLLHSVQTEYGAHPASYTMGTGALYLGGKRDRAWSWPLASI
jgi:hypothetical protein